MFKKIATFFSLALFSGTLALAAPPQDQSLIDIEGHAYVQAITELYNTGVISGDGGGKRTYRPDDGIDRAEITKIIVFANVPQSELTESYNTKCFADVLPNRWYTKSICYAKEQGWVQGFKDGNFKPQQSVSNFEGMVIAAKAYDISFTTEITPWYSNLVEIFSRRKLIPYTIYQANADLTRGEMADLITRLIKEESQLLAEYLGDRVNLIVSMETIKKGLKINEFQSQELKP